MTPFPVGSFLRNRLVIYTLILFVILIFLGIFAGRYKVVAIAWIAFCAMAGPVPWGRRSARHQSFGRLIAAYGLSAGAMITSAVIFLAPTAINRSVLYGSLGIAAGFITGYFLDRFNHVFSQRFSVDIAPVVMELSLHALAAGLIIGVIYASMPRLSLILGVAIVSHKAPAGYAAARRLAAKHKNPYTLLLPSAAIGITALPVSLLHISLSAVMIALIFGFATGVFLHIGMSFLPIALINGAGLEYEEALKKVGWLRTVLSIAGGGLVVALLWLMVR